MLRLTRIFCPGCGAPIDPGEDSRVTCSYCGSVLQVMLDSVTQTQGTNSATKGSGGYEPPLSGLSAVRSPRFELSFLEQLAPGTMPDGFFPLPLSDERFALVFLRLVDDRGNTKSGQLEPLCELVKESLSREEDPGLAAFQALDHLAQDCYDGKLEIAILLFSPRRSCVVVYNAGCPNSIWWVSSEEGRVIDSFRAYPPLEKRMLRQANDHFSNSSPCYLAAGDLIVGVSAAYAGRGGGPYAGGTRSLTESLNENLGEHPLRVVTLAKNAYWSGLAPAAIEKPLSGHLRVAAVRALPPAVSVESLDLSRLHTVEYDSFEVARRVADNEFFELLHLHDERACCLWFGNHDIDQTIQQNMREAVLEVLDRPNHGDNENPREAGRRALAVLGRPCQIFVLQLIPRYGRAKWFRSGWQQPLCLGPRGLRDPARTQMFDEGGEATIEARARLFFPGALPLEGPAPDAEELARHWNGGKSSALYGALFSHWRTTNGERALGQLLRAALADQPGSDISGAALLTRKAGI